MKQETYQGWKNYETWLVNLHLTNEEPSYRYWLAEAERISGEASETEQVVSGIWTAEEAARYKLAEQLRDEVTEAAPSTEALLYADLIDAALTSVDWDEVAQHWLGKD